jgi:hypothetical protein
MSKIHYFALRAENLFVINLFLVYYLLNSNCAGVYMKIKLFVLVAVLFVFIPCYSQTSSLTSGTLTAANPTLTPCPSGAVRNFRYVGVNTDISGLVSPNFTGATMSECYGDACCKYGIGFKIRDSVIGNNNFRSETTPSVLINGTTYTGVIFKGSLNISGTVKIPFHYRKKQTATLTGTVNMSGGLRVFLTPIDVTNNTPVYTQTFADSNAKVTITIQPRQGNETRFDVTSLKYEFANSN